MTKCILKITLNCFIAAFMIFFAISLLRDKLTIFLLGWWDVTSQKICMCTQHLSQTIPFFEGGGQWPFVTRRKPWILWIFSIPTVLWVSLLYCGGFCLFVSSSNEFLLFFARFVCLSLSQRGAGGSSGAWACYLLRWLRQLPHPRLHPTPSPAVDTMQ